MEQIANFTAANEILKTYIPQMSQREAYTLERMTGLMEKLGNPQERYKVIHVAGTSGKTSTAYYITSLLKAHGAKVGLTVSPHVDEVNERLQVGLKPLPEKTFCGNLTRFINIVEKTGIKPTYFELLVAFAYWYFAKTKVDYAVIEVGLGGLLDGTNVVDRTDKVCVITDIGLDHTSILGNDLPSIAAQKAGIIHPRNVVFFYKQSAEVMSVFREVSESRQAEPHEVVFPKIDGIPENLPLFQKRNWHLAQIVTNFIANRDNLPKLTKKELYETTDTYVPARMEIVKRKGKTIIIDGSHNPQKLRALVKSIQTKFPEAKFAVLLGMLNERSEQVRAVLKEISPIAESVTATTFFAGQDIPRDPLNPFKIVEAGKKLGLGNVQYERSPEEAFKNLLVGSHKYVLVTGSFFLLNHIRPVIFKDND